MDNSNSVFEELARATIATEFPDAEVGTKHYNELMQHVMKSNELAACFDSTAFETYCTMMLKCLSRYASLFTFTSLSMIPDSFFQDCEHAISEINIYAKTYQAANNLASIEIANVCYNGNSLKDASFSQGCEPERFTDASNAFCEIERTLLLADSFYDLSSQVFQRIESDWKFTKEKNEVMRIVERVDKQQKETSTPNSAILYPVSDSDFLSSEILLIQFIHAYPTPKFLLDGCNRELFETLHAMQQRENATKDTPLDQSSEADAVEEPVDEDTQKKIQQLERDTPQLDISSNDWVKSKFVKSTEFIDTTTLRTYRSRGIKNKQKLLGQDDYGRVWRKGSKNGGVFYLRSSLLNNK